MSAAAEIAASLRGKPNGSGWIARCPCHMDENPSLSIGEGSDGRVLLKCHAGCSQESLMAEVRDMGFDLSGRRPANSMVATYDYRDSDGVVRYQVVRRKPKRFSQRQPDGRGGWTWSMDGVKPLPYRLPEMLAEPSKPVFVVEGEKDADRLTKDGLVATTNSGGAEKWRDELNAWFKDRNVVILPDNDDTGRRHAAKVVHKLRDIARKIRIVALPGLPQKGDVSDWLTAGKTVRDLRRLAHETPLWEPEAADEATREDAASDADARPPEFSDDALALRFSEEHGEDARHVALWGKWLLWNGTSWQFDDTLRSFDMARTICRAASAEIDDPKRAKLASAIASARTVAAIVTLSRADRRHAVATDQFDPDPMIFNAKRTLELRTGTSREPSREDYCTKTAAAVPGDDCPRWLKFLGEITSGNEELQGYLRRVAGYCMTGLTTEHVMFFCYGTGANGKSVFINTLAGIWGDYAVTAPMETFVVSRSDHHPTELAMLRGARLVVAHETERGRRWAEAKIKALTGGDKISARFMRQDFFEFTPQFKLMISGNHKPGLRGVDEASRRRLHLIPFDVTIPPEKRNPKLFDELREEWGGILQWAIDGCLEWQRIGLAPPAAVRDATDAYLASEDSIANWLDDRCEQDPTFSATRGRLFDDWKEWAEGGGEHPGAAKEFYTTLEGRGFRQFKDHSNRKFRGLRLRPEPEVRVASRKKI